jgi:hypothetical protein
MTVLQLILRFHTCQVSVWCEFWYRWMRGHGWIGRDGDRTSWMHRCKFSLPVGITITECGLALGRTWWGL